MLRLLLAARLFFPARLRQEREVFALRRGVLRGSWECSAVGITRKLQLEKLERYCPTRLAPGYQRRCLALGAPIQVHAPLKPRRDAHHATAKHHGAEP